LRDLSDIHGTSVVDAASEGPMGPVPDGSLGFCASHTGHALCADFNVGAYNAQFGMFNTSPNEAAPQTQRAWGLGARGS
jgi:hypothetical protein